MDRRRRAYIGGGIVVLVALAAAIVWWGPLRSGGGGDDALSLAPGDPAASAARAFAAAWQGGTLDEVPATIAGDELAQRSLALTSGLGAGVGSSPAKVEVTGLTEVTGLDVAGDPGATVTTAPTPDAPRRARAALRVSWVLDDQRTWTYDSAVDLVEQPTADGGDPTWLVDWNPQVVQPRLREHDRLQVVRLAARRGEVLGLDGQALVGLRPVVYVGIRPGETTDRAAAASQVAAIVGVDAAALRDRVVAAGADTVVSVITLRQEQFEPKRAALEAVSGTVFQDDEIPLAPTRDFARALLGTVGPATAEQVAASDGRLQAGDLTGQSGLQATQDEVLAGRPGLSIRAVPSEGPDTALVLKEFPAVDGTSVTITLDPEIQKAAEQALATAPNPAALVAIRPSTGDVLAVANGPAGADGYNRAMVGTYPPGSTFKVASGLTLLENGVTPDTPVDCPATIVVGKEFSNAEGEVLGTVPFRKDFADSCNTAFVGQSRTITAQQLADTAARLGFRDLDVGAPLKQPSVPATAEVTEHAANMIGQGKVSASPFTVALMSASVAAGRSVEPRLVVDPDQPDPTPGEPLPAEPVAQLRDLMRQVVTSGTGTALAGIPGGDVAGKTGTAEFGTDDPPRTHAWFTGFQGDVAFAVLVEDGGFGGSVAAPIAARFLTTLAAG